jgi:hypothetical protein
MKKLRLLLAFFVASIGVLQNATARTAPALPEAQAPTSGQYYYLYNVMEGKFLCRSTTNTNYAGLGTYGDKILVTATEEENGYTIKWADNKYFFVAYDNYITSTNSPSSWRDYFIFAESSKGYTIQRSSKNTNYYKADEFIGFNVSNGDRLSPALTEGSIHWLFYAVDDAEYYMAKHKLFTYLEVADQYNFYITQYELVYDNPAATTAELNQAQATLKNALDMSQNYVSPSWTEYPILFQNNTDNKWELYNSNKGLRWYYVNNAKPVETTSTLAATVNVDADATLCYTYSGDWYSTLRVYLDGELVQIISGAQAEMGDRRYYVEMPAGKHDVTWTCLLNDATKNNYSHTQYLSGIGIMNTPTITPATTTVEGQLGTEVLKVTYPESAISVKKIVINGIIGEDDWATIKLMKNAFSIDMSGATTTAPMPKNMFNNNNGGWPFLHNVKLPQNLTAIGDYAFLCSDVDNEITFPETMTSIGYQAFQKSKIKAAYMPEGITSIGSNAFSNCYYMENVSYPSTAATISNYCFNNCRHLRTFAIPEGVTTIEAYAFQNCWHFNPRFPSTVSEIKGHAFQNTATDSLFVAENMTVSSYAFEECRELVYAEWPTTFFRAELSYSQVVSSCPKLNKVKLMSPTVVTYESSDFLYGNTRGNITLQVPDFLEFSYMLDKYWYNCKVEAYSSADQKDWNIRQPLVLNEGQRIGGTPNLDVRLGGNITVNGAETQTIGNLKIDYSPIEFYNGSYNISQQWGMMLSNTDMVNITGELCEWVLTKEKQWYFLTLPFDTKVGDIQTNSYADGKAASYAIRYYDGAQRATIGTGSNWKNYTADDIIPAGTGFIFQTSKSAYSKFVAQTNASKQYIFSNKEFVKALAANPSEVTANKGWNLVGNPWQTFYNIHKLNFTAPITVWNYDNKTYKAYSIIDDNYAIKPLEAIFVQCPDEVNSISFPIDGRQLTSKIESQNASRADVQSERKLIDVELSHETDMDGSAVEVSDKTRFVMNPKASMDYEVSCDASKFMSMANNVPQIWTVEQGVQMAINERPMGDGTVQIGFKVAQGGLYTISAPRNQFKNIVLVDNEMGIETDLSSGSYTFSADAGINNNRFTLHVGGVVITGIGNNREAINNSGSVYNLNGQRITTPQKGLYIVNGKKVLK